MLKIIAYVESPFQLTNCIHWIKYSGNQECVVEILVRTSTNNKLTRKMQHISRINPIGNYKYVEVANGRIMKILSLFKIGAALLCKSFIYDKIIIGDARNIIARIILKLPFFVIRKIILVDDGLYLLDHIDKIAELPITVYSTLPLESANYNLAANVNIEKQKIGDNIENNGSEAIIFIGTKLTEIGFISEDDYLKRLAEIYSPDKQALYFPHREESSEKIKLVQAIGFNIVETNSSIEDYFEVNGAPVGDYYSYYSTALLNLSLRIPFASFKAINIDLNKLPLAEKNAIKRCYEIFKLSGIEILE